MNRVRFFLIDILINFIIIDLSKYKYKMENFIEAVVFTKGYSGYQHRNELVFMLKKNGIKIKKTAIMNFTDEQIREHYLNIAEKKEIFKDVCRMMKFFKHFVCIVEVPSIDILKNVVGEKTDPKACSEGTFRAMYGKNLTYNAAHRSGSEEDALREVAHFRQWLS